jgi:glycosyltransferase involved in cell wall biosynthesis
MRLLYVHSGTDLYGASKALARMVAAEIAIGNSVCVVVPGLGPLNSLLEQSGAQVVVHSDLLRISHHRGGVAGLLFKLLTSGNSSTRRLVATIRRFKPDVVHSNTATVLSGAFAARAARIPHVWHIREFFSDNPFLWKIYRQIILRLSREVICTSKGVATQFSAAAANPHVHVLYDAIPASEYSIPLETEVHDFKARFGIPPGSLIASVVGRIHDRKGQETFVKAAALLTKQFPHAHFLIVGSAFPGNDHHFRRLMRLVKELGLDQKVIFTGEVERVSLVYAATDVLVMPSTFPEAFGLVVLEAMAFGKPTISSELGGPVEIIIPEVTGLLSPPNDPACLAAAMKRLFLDRDFAQRLGAAGRQRFLSMFDTGSFLQRLNHVYHELLTTQVDQTTIDPSLPELEKGTASWRPCSSPLSLRVAFVHSGADLYGASRSLLRLVECCQNDGMTVLVVLPSTGSLVARLQALGATVEVQTDLTIIARGLNYKLSGLLAWPFTFIFGSLRLARRLSEFRADLVHSNTATILSGAVAARIARIPHIWHIREIFSEFPRGWLIYRRFIDHFSSRIVCVSHAVFEQFADCPASSKAIVVYNGLLPPEYDPPTDDDAKAFRANLGIPRGAKLVGIVGRIKLQRKGHDVFVKAAARVAKRFPEVLFLIVGRVFPGLEAHHAELLALIQSLGIRDRVIFAGELADTRIVYKSVDMLVMPSALPEPFGLVLIEAMSFARPVVCTTNGGGREIVVHGECGYMVEPNDHESLAEAIERILEDDSLARSLGEQGRRRFLRHFRFELSFEVLKSVYESACNERINHSGSVVLEPRGWRMSNHG